MLSVSRYDRNLKLINKYLFGQEYDNDKNTKLEKIKQFQEVLTQFVRLSLSEIMRKLLT